MSLIYRVSMDINQQIDIEIPDDIVALGGAECYNYACKYGQSALEDPDSHTYIDWSNRSNQVLHITAVLTRKD